MKDLGRTHVPDELLDHGFAGKAEFMDAALDGRGSELQTQPVVKEFLDLAPREAEAERQCRDEGGEHRAHQAALAQLQIPPTALDLRARPDAGAGDGLVAARTAHGEVDVFGRRDLKSHFAAEEFEAVMGADASALQVETEGGSAGAACRRRVRNFSARDNRLTAPVPFRAGLFAGGLAGLLLARIAGFLGRGGGRLAAARTGRGGLSSLAAPIGIVARRRTRAGRRVLAQAVGQRARQLVLPPSPLLDLLARHRGEVGSLDIFQVGVESARHARRRILFAPTRKPSTRSSDRDRPHFATEANLGWGVNGYSAKTATKIVLPSETYRRTFGFTFDSMTERGTTFIPSIIGSTVYRSSMSN